MTRFVVFDNSDTLTRSDGSPRYAVGRPAGTTPYTGPIKVREEDDGAGNTRLETYAGWEPGDVVEFNRTLAEQYGHACDGKACDSDTCQGDCFAEMFVDDQNRRFDKSEETKVFRLLKTDPRKRNADIPATTNLVAAPVQDAPSSVQES